MNKTLFLSAFALAIYSCQSTNTTEMQAKQNSAITTKAPVLFFDFDAIDYYTTNYEWSIPHKKLSATGSLQREVALNELPDTVNMEHYVAILHRANYQQNTLDPKYFDTLNTIFVEKEKRVVPTHPCLKIYRDILVFKKEDKITGLAKICFGCNDVQFKGANANTAYFGQEDEYGVLASVLQK